MCPDLRNRCSTDARNVAADRPARLPGLQPGNDQARGRDGVEHDGGDHFTDPTRHLQHTRNPGVRGAYRHGHEEDHAT